MGALFACSSASLTDRLCTRFALSVSSVLLDHSCIAVAARREAVLVIVCLILVSRLRLGLLSLLSIASVIVCMNSALCMPVHIWCPSLCSRARLM